MYKGNLPIGGLDNLNEVAECNRNLPRGVGEVTRLSGIGGDQFTGFVSCRRGGASSKKDILVWFVLVCFSFVAIVVRIVFHSFQSFRFFLAGSGKIDRGGLVGSIIARN